MTKRYASDITREQFELIKTILESARKPTKPRVIDLYEVFCAVLYLLKRVVSGGYCHMNFQNGGQYINIFKIGAVKERKDRLAALSRP
jgi:hypothetical protein